MEIIGVRFKSVGKIYYFTPNGAKVSLNDKVIVETVRGVECGEVAVANKEISAETASPTTKPIMRVATAKDLATLKNNKKKEEEIFALFEKKIAFHKLTMKAISVDYSFDGSKILFFFTSENRVDFRDLVKDLASIYHTRIELRQIGVRDEAKAIGGLGICGRAFCCSTFLEEFQPVSIKMAKEQSLSLNPVKISGTCGRLMCCLKYEEDVYEDLVKITPKVGAIVDTEEGRGMVEDANILTGKLKIRLDKKRDAAPIFVKKDDVKLIKDGSLRLNRDEIVALKSLED